MTHGDRVDDEQLTEGTDTSDNAAESTASAGVEHAAEGVGPQLAPRVAGPDEGDDDTDATDAPPAPVTAPENEPTREHRGAEASRQPFNVPFVNLARDFVNVPAMFDIANSPAARMVREVAKATENMSRYALPHLQPPVLGVLSDPTFLKTLETFTKSVTVPQMPRIPTLLDSPQWRQLVGALPTVQHLFLARQIAPLQAAMFQHAQYLAGIIESTANFRELVNSLSRSPQINWARLFPNLKQLRKTFRTRLLASFVRADLWPAPSMPVELLNNIGELARRSDPRPVLLAVWNHYARQNHAALDQAIAAWWDDPEYAARRHIFEAALSGHRQKLYELTIPTLLAQVEGIAGDFVHGSVPVVPAPKLGKSSQIVRHAIEVAGNAGITDPDDAELLHVVLVEAVITHVQHVSFESADFAAQYADIRKRRKLNRHGTLHGIQINYPSAMNSLRCFLLLDALHALRKHAREIDAKAAARTSL